VALPRAGSGDVIVGRTKDSCLTPGSLLTPLPFQFHRIVPGPWAVVPAMGSELNISSVAVIGAGISGVVAAAHLKQQGITVTVYERNHASGGVW